MVEVKSEGGVLAHIRHQGSATPSTNEVILSIAIVIHCEPG